MKFRCKVCGEIFEAESIEKAVCPKCGVKGDKLEEIHDEVTEKSNPYAGTQTEKNLEAAFAGESMARNKYTYFASVAKKEGFEQMSAIYLKTADNEKNTLKCGSRNSKASEIPAKISLLPLTAKTTSGRICMKILPKLPRKRDSLNLPQNSVQSVKLKNIMKNAIVLC